MTSSPEAAPQGWQPPSLTRTPAVPGSDAWLLADLGSAAPAAGPHDASYEAGYADGLRDGVEQSGAALAPALAALMGAAHALDGQREAIVRDRSRDLQVLALAIARQIVQREVAADPQLLAGWIARAIELLPDDLQVDVRMHPADLDSIGSRPESLAASPGVTLRWIADPSVGRAGFVLETPQRMVDGRLDEALRGLYERFNGD